MTSTRRRNHYVPRFLLKRFASRSLGKKSWIWQVPQEGDPVEISTRDAAVARDFYGSPGSGVEDAFANAETRFAEVLSRIDSGEPPQQHHEDLRELAWTLVARTRAFRQQFAQFFDGLLERALDSVTQPNHGDRLTQELAARVSVAWEQHMAKLPPSEQAEVRRRLELVGLGDDARDISSRLLGSPLARQFREEFLNAAPPRAMERASAKGQIEGLQKTLASSSVPEWFRPHRWTIHRADGTLILGDGCVFARTGAGRISSLVLAREDWEQVYLPVSPSRILVGSRTDHSALVDAEEINDYSVGLSWTHFFSSTIAAPIRARARAIGSIASQLIEAEISALVSQV